MASQAEVLAELVATGEAGLAVRARIVLACAEPGSVNEQVAAELGVSALTVGKWRRQFAAAGLAGLADAARPGRPKAGLDLTDAERGQLTQWARRAKSAQALALRARIVLACAGGKENKQVAAELRVSCGSGSRRWPGGGTGSSRSGWTG